ncbi:glycosyltransferase family 2 protein [Dermabacteraceae bacterium P13088]
MSESLTGYEDVAGAVTVLIPVYGPSPEVPQLISALRADSPEVAVIVVDDCSPEPFSLAEDIAGVRVVHRQRNGGFGAAVNTGIALVETPLVLVLNSDLELPTGFLPALLRNYRPWHPAVMGVRAEDAAGHVAYAGRYWPTLGHQVTEWLVPLAGLRHRDSLHERVGHDVAADRCGTRSRVNWVSGAVMLLPVSEVRAIGGFDESYFMYCEEVDLQRRLAAAGVPAVLDASLTVLHEGGGSADNLRRRQWLVSARHRYARKFANVHALDLSLRLASWVNFVWNCARRLAGRDVQPLKTLRYELGLLRTARKESR